jgi:hypothetical protein
MGLTLFDFITIFFGGLLTCLETAGVTGRMFADGAPTAGPVGELPADTTVAAARQAITAIMVVEIAFIVVPFLSQLVR